MFLDILSFPLFSAWKFPFEIFLKFMSKFIPTRKSCVLHSEEKPFIEEENRFSRN